MNGRFTAAVLAVAVLAGCGGAGDGDGLAGPTGPAGSTGPTGPSGPTAAELAWLDPHNDVRAGTYPGVTVSPVPAPALPALSWSASAAAVAQAWAEGCTWGHNPALRTLGLGENIAALAPAGRSDATPAYVVGQWAGEWVGYHHDTNTCTPPAPPAPQTCGHYTQLVWRGTTGVGCAKVTCTVNSPFGAGFPTWDYFVCDYEPPGNWDGQRPY